MTNVNLTLAGVELVLDDDVNSYTSAEMAAVERATGMRLREFAAAIMDPDDVSVLALLALAWIGARRAGDHRAFDEFGEAVPVLELMRTLRTQDPDPAPANRADRRRATKHAPKTRTGVPSVSRAGVPVAGPESAVG